MDKLIQLKAIIEKSYAQNGQNLLFHGWHHVQFVFHKSVVFAHALQADQFLVQSAALCHDVNHLTDPNSETIDGKTLRKQYLAEAGYNEHEIDQIETIVCEAEIESRDENISKEAKALSDADTLFKSLPVTPLIFTSRYIQEKQSNLKKLATSIVAKQQPIMDAGIYFYTEIANQKYLAWAKTNLQLWTNVVEALADDDIQTMLVTGQQLIENK